MKKSSILIIILIIIVILVGCSQNNDSYTSPQDNSEHEGLPTTATEQKVIKLEEIKSIELFDLDENPVGKAFTAQDIEDIITAYNESTIDENMYIMMITGNKMVISFVDGSQINITSYGSETNIVATGETGSYHLVCPGIAKILYKIKEYPN